MDKDICNRLSEIFTTNPATLCAATTGLDGRPGIWPASFAFLRDGAMYFLTLKSSMFYAGLSKTPYIQFLAFDRDTGGSVRLSGKVCFTEDEDITGSAAEACPGVLEKAGGNKKMLIAFFLTGAEAVIETAGEEETFRLPDPSGVLIGLKIKKKTELRDRISKILGQRETDPPRLAEDDMRLFDGALFVFAEAAKAIWPRMDIRSIERSAEFETYDEREKYTSQAALLIGNAVIDKPEDLTYWLDPSKWSGGKFSG